MTTGKQALFEDWYREQWLKQNKIDAVHNPMARPAPPRSRKGEDIEVRKEIKLSKQAEIVNRMLNQQMLGRQIGELLGISQQAVSEIKRRYGLPRKPEEVSK
jgi:DNA-directed RNA polymerase specialized sigma subunit